jgi:hypothetical protein
MRFVSLKGLQMSRSNEKKNENECDSAGIMHCKRASFPCLFVTTACPDKGGPLQKMALLQMCTFEIGAQMLPVSMRPLY